MNANTPRLSLALACLAFLAAPLLADAASARQVAAGSSHSCAVTATGGVKCWGSNAHGQLGDGTTTDRLTPTDVVGLGSGIGSVAAGEHHTCAVTTTGGVKCWGSNESGQLGDGTKVDRPTPVDIAGLGNAVAAVSLGSNHTCGMTTAGGVKCWGANYYGELGDGTLVDRSTPLEVSGLGSGVAALSVGAKHSCALTASGGVKCWGYNRDGQLGDGEPSLDARVPVNVADLLSGVAAIATGSYHTCAVTATSGVKCWGNNISGQIGDGTTRSRSTPVDVAGLAGSAVGVVAGGLSTCATLSDGNMECWGDNDRGKLGDGTAVQRLTPTEVLRLPSSPSSVAVGGAHACVVTTGGGIRCWGGNESGQIGDGGACQRL